MRGITILAAALFIAVGVGGYALGVNSGSTVDVRVPTVTTIVQSGSTPKVSVPVTTTVVVDDEGTYVAMVRDIIAAEYPGVATIDDEMLLGLGYQLCDLVEAAERSNVDPETAIYVLGMETVDAFEGDVDKAGYVLGAILLSASATLCPEYGGYIDDMFNSVTG